MKKWTVYYKSKGIGRPKSHECGSREKAIEFIVKLKKSGDTYCNLRLNGNFASVSLTIELDRESEKILNKISN